MGGAMTAEKKIKVGKQALYKGYAVFLNSRDSQYYYAVYEGAVSTSRVPRDLMLEMTNIAKGEYLGKIPVDDPDLKIE